MTSVHEMLTYLYPLKFDKVYL